MSVAAMLTATVQALSELNVKQPPGPDALKFQEKLLVSLTNAWEAGYHWSVSLFSIAVRRIILDVAKTTQLRTGAAPVGDAYLEKVTFAIQCAMMATEGPSTRSAVDAAHAPPDGPQVSPPGRTSGGDLIPEMRPAKRQKSFNLSCNPDVASAIINGAANGTADGAAQDHDNLSISYISAKGKKRRRRILEKHGIYPRIPCSEPECSSMLQSRGRLSDHLHDVHGFETPSQVRNPTSIKRFRNDMMRAKIAAERPKYRARRDELIYIADTIARDVRAPGWRMPEAVEILRQEAAEDKKLSWVRSKDSAKTAEDVKASSYGDDEKFLNASLRAVTSRVLIAVRINGLPKAVAEIMRENERVGIVSADLDRWLRENPEEAKEAKLALPASLSAHLGVNGNRDNDDTADPAVDACEVVIKQEGVDAIELELNGASGESSDTEGGTDDDDNDSGDDNDDDDDDDGIIHWGDNPPQASFALIH